MRKKNIAIYLRISTDKQLLDAQETAIENWLAAHSIDESTVSYYRDDGISGTSTKNRPGLQALLQAIRHRKVKTLVTFELSRLSRDYMDFLRIMELCDKHGVTIQVPNDGKISFESNQDKLIASIKAFLAAEERQKISQRTKAGLESARKRGIKLGRPPGTRTNKGWRKKHDLQMLDDIKVLADKGLSAANIAKLLEGKWDLSPSTILRLRRKISLN